MGMAPVYVMTSDLYIDALLPFAYLLRKYWYPPPTVIVGGFSAPPFPLPDNFTFHSLGKFEEFPVNRWSDALTRMLLELPHEVFVLMLEDYWLTREVDVTAIEVACDYMNQFEYVARFDLTGDRKFSGFAKPYGKAGHVNLLLSDPDSQYHCSLMAAVWRRKHLLKVLVPGETPWETELNGTNRLRDLREHCIVLGTEEIPLKHTLAFRGGENGKVLLDEIPRQDVEDMTTLGLLRPWGVS